MRDIKFRAWDEGKHIMHYDFQFIQSGDEGNDWIVFKSSHPSYNLFDVAINNPSFSQQLKKMQYTGLKDKNGKEIYEGDIITRTKFNGEFVHNTKVRWSDASAGFVVETLEAKEFEGEPHTLTYPLNGGLSRIGEIIGNIYEHKHLVDADVQL
jgi:uncharacterized phage protein (TIGR01671 family)